MDNPSTTDTQEPKDKEQQLQGTEHTVEPVETPAPASQPVAPVQTPVQPIIQSPEVGLAQPTPPPATPPKQNNAVTLILQWLTYSSWLWFGGAMVWLSAVVVGFFISGSSDFSSIEIVVYPIAAVIVLLLVSGILDFFYARREPAHKEGFASVIMVIYAVIFALTAIGTLIVAVFSLINTVIQSGGNDSSEKGPLIVFLAALVGLIVHVILLTRILLAGRVHRIPMIVTAVMIVTSIAFIIASFVGPVANAIVAKQDQQLEEALPDVVYSVNEYARTNGKLPTSLDSLNVTQSYSSSSSKDAKEVIAKNLVKYTANTKAPEEDRDMYYTMSDAEKSTSGTGVTTYFYRLCVDWHAEKNSNYESNSSETSGVSASEEPAYDSYLSTYSHKKGEQCYDLSTRSY